ncbi:MAG: GDP-mannose 4,6-dehydratase [Legionella sp.]|nr:GDP-mannose 4,6-dehydratase [Legionella sp.]
MSYLVLGSNSFAGSSFVNFLLNLDHRVIGISRSKKPDDTLLAYSKHPKKSNFTFHQLDMNQDIDQIISCIQREKPTVIVDFAGQGMVAESWNKPEQWYQTNIVSKVKLHHFLCQCDFLDKYVRVSTPEVYGHTAHSVKEGAPFAPSTPYAVSHAATDLSLLAFYRQYQFPVVLTRFANFYGPHQQLYRIIPRTMIYALTGQRLLLHGGGTSKRAFIYGDDVAQGLEAVIQKGRIGETYHFSAGNVISIADLVKNICQLMQVEYDGFVEIAPDRPSKDAQYIMDTQRAEDELDWKPSMSLEMGLEKTMAWIKQDLIKIKASPLEYIHKA